MYRNCREETRLSRTLRFGRPGAGEERAECEECGEELFYGDRAYTWLNARGREKLVCAGCLEELFDELSLEDKAALVGSARVIISKRRNLERC